MDPLSALSVAGTIIQFVDFGTKLLSSSYELYKSRRGSLKINQELELVTADLQAVVTKMRKCCSTIPGDTIRPIAEEAPRDENSFHQICDETANVAEELLKGLRRLKVKDTGCHILNSFRAALDNAWSKDQIRELTERLSVLKESLQSRSLLSIQQVQPSTPRDIPYSLTDNEAGTKLMTVLLDLRIGSII